MAQHIKQGLSRFGDDAKDAAFEVGRVTDGTTKYGVSCGPFTASSGVVAVTYGYTFSAAPDV